MTPLIATGHVFGSAGVPPVGSRGVKTYIITGETPALLKTILKPSFNCIVFVEQRFCKKCRLMRRFLQCDCLGRDSGVLGGSYLLQQVPVSLHQIP